MDPDCSNVSRCTSGIVTSARSRGSQLMHFATTMQIHFLEQPTAEVIAREDGSDGEFFVRGDGSMWYRNVLKPDDLFFVNFNQLEFRRAADALHRYNEDVLRSGVEEVNLLHVRHLERALRVLINPTRFGL